MATGFLAWVLAISVLATPPAAAQDVPPPQDEADETEVGLQASGPLWKPAEPQTGLPADVFDEDGRLIYPDLGQEVAPPTAETAAGGTPIGFVEGVSVPVADETTETVEVFANPDGTRTAFISMAPVRTRNDAGEWAPIDTDLVVDETGDFVPANTIADVTVLATPEEAGDSTVIAEVAAPGSDEPLRVGVEGAVLDAGQLTANGADVQTGAPLVEAEGRVALSAEVEKAPEEMPTESIEPSVEVDAGVWFETLEPPADPSALPPPDVAERDAPNATADAPNVEAPDEPARSEVAAQPEVTDAAASAEPATVAASSPEDAIAGVAVEATASGIKTTYVLASAPGVDGVVETVALPDGWSAEQTAPGADIALLTANGVQQGVWTGGPLWDAAGSSDGLYDVVGLDLIDVVDGVARARLVFPDGWLSDPARQWPVFADPEVDLSGRDLVDDTWVTEFKPNERKRWDDNLWVGHWGALDGGGNGRMASLITFDWDGAGSGVTVNNATLSLMHRRTADPRNSSNPDLPCATPITVDVVGVATYWDIANVNWSNRPVSGDFGGTQAPTAPMQPRHDVRTGGTCTEPGRVLWNVTSLFEYWADPANVVNNPDGKQGGEGSGYYGMYLIGPAGEQLTTRSVAFFSSEGAEKLSKCPDANCAPLMTVTYNEGAPIIEIGANTLTSGRIEVTATRPADIPEDVWAPDQYRYRFIRSAERCPADGWTPSTDPVEHEVVQPWATYRVPPAVVDAQFAVNNGRLVVCAQVRQAGVWSPWSIQRFGLDDPTSAAFGFDADGEYIDGVHTGMGNYLESWTDVSLATSGPALEVTRTLNTDAMGGSGAFGPGFAFNYEIRLSELRDDPDDEHPAEVTVTLADGSISTFESDGAGGFIPPSGETMTVTSSGGSYVLESLERTQYHFSPADGGNHVLDRIVDVHGLQLSMARNDDGQLETVTDEETGRFIEFGWDADRVTTVSIRDSRLGANERLTWIYQYEGSPSRLKRVCSPGQQGQAAACSGAGVYTTYGWAVQRGDTSTPEDDGWRVISIRRPETARALRITYLRNTGMRVASVTNEENEQTTYRWAQAGEQVKVTVKERDAAGTRWLTTTQWYDSEFRVVRDKRPGFPGSTLYTYNPESGLRETITDAAGNSSTLAYNSDRRLTRVVNGAGEVTTYRYDTNGNQTHVCGGRNPGAGSDTHCTFTQFGPMTLPDGVASNASVHQPSQRTHPDGGWETWVYTADGQVDRHVDVLGLVTEYSYVDGDLWTMKRSIDGDTLTFEWFTHDRQRGFLTDRWQQVIAGTIHDPSIGYEYDYWGQVTKITGPGIVTLRGQVDPIEQLETIFTYDHRGNVRTRTLQELDDPTTARVSGFEVDGLDREITMTYQYQRLVPGSNDVTIETAEITTAYDCAGNVATVTDANGVTIRTTYDNKNLPVQVQRVSVAGDPRKIDMCRRNGFPAGSVRPGGLSVVEVLSATTYDGVGRVESALETHTVSANGQPDESTTTRVEYDGADRPKLTYISGFEDPNGEQRDRRLTETAYDDYGRVTTFSEGGTRNGPAERVTHFEAYDDADRVTQIRLELDGPDRRTAIAYNHAGQVTKTTVTEDVDRSGSVEPDETAVTEHRYDKAGRLVCTRVGNGGGEDVFTQFGYDGRGLLLWESAPNDTPSCAADTTVRTDHRYDRAGYHISTTSPEVPLNGFTRSVRPVVKYGRNAFGEITHYEDERGNVTVTSYDQAGRPVEVRHPRYTPPGAGAITPVERFAYDANGNLIRQVDRRGYATTYSFDAFNRVIEQVDPLVTGQAAAGQWTVSYNVDGTVDSTTDPTGAVVRYDYDQLDQVLTETQVVRGMTVPSPTGGTVQLPGSDVVTRYRYNDLGSAVSMTNGVNNTTRYEYDAAQRQRAVIDPDGDTTKIEYSVHGNVAAIVTPAGVVHATTFDPAGRSDGTGVYASETAWSSQEALRRTSADLDDNGNVIVATDEDDNTVSYSYDALNRLTSVSQTVTVTDPPPAPEDNVVVMVVGNPNKLTSGDKALRTRLLGLGYTIRLVNDGAALPDLDGVELVVITDSTVASQVRKYDVVAVPVLVLEHAAWDDLGLTKSNGVAAAGRNVSITGDTELDAGLSGTVSMITRSRLTMATDAQLAEAAITVAGPSAGQHTVFAYEAGAVMASADAPARRVAFGVTTPAVPRLTANGWSLFDAAVAWATTAIEPPPVEHAALVVGRPTNLSAGDIQLRNRLVRLGYQVSIVDDHAAVPATDGLALVVVADTAASSLLGKYKDAAVPLIVAEHGAWDDLGLSGVSGGGASGQNVEISNDTDLDADLSGTVRMITRSSMTRVDSAQLGADAIEVAAHQSGGQTIFAYDAGATMDSGVAPARRVGIGITNGAATRLTAEGWFLFDAAVRWATAPARHAVLVVANPNSVAAGDQVLIERLEAREFVVRVVDDNAALPSLDDVSLIVVSDSAVASRVRKYENVAVPLIALEFAAWDDLGLTTTNGRGVTNHSLRISGDTDLDAGLSGTVRVLEARKRMNWIQDGRLGADAIKVASRTNGGQIVFAYEANTAMADGAAPARRVGFGYSLGALPSLNDNGRALFDAAIDWAVSPPTMQPLRVALVVNKADSLTTADEALMTLLTGQGHPVTLFSQTDSAPVSGFDVAIVAYSANLVGGQSIASWRDASFGVVTARHWDFDDFGLTESGQPGAVETDNAVISAPSHPVAGGLSGTVAVVTGPWSMRTNPVADLGADATAIAVEDGHTPLYVYDSGDRLVGHTNASPNTAPGRRVAFNLRDNAVTRLTASGTQLLTAAVYWAAGSTPPPLGALAAAQDAPVAAAALAADAQVLADGQRLETITFTYGYDPAGNVTRIVDGRNNVWIYTYNEWGLQEDVVEPSTEGQVAGGDRRYRMLYDAGGFPAMEILPGNVRVESIYDQLGRRTVLRSGGLEERTGFDMVGQLVSASHPDGEISFRYNDVGLLVSTSGAGEVSAYDYDAAGQLERRYDAAGTWVHTWTDDGRIETALDPVTGVAVTYGYNDDDRLETVTYGGGVGTRRYTYDNSGRLSGDTWTNAGGTVWAAQYGYDDRGNVTQKSVTSPGSAGAGAWSYAYDEASRLVEWTHDGEGTLVGWDANGNRTSHGYELSTFDARNRLVSSPDGVFVWSPRGTLVSVTGDNPAAYEFDALGRMTSVSTDDDVVALVYDGLDRVASRNGVAFGYNGGSWDPVSVGAGVYGRSPGGSLVSVDEGDAAVAVRDRHGDVVATVTAAGLLGSTAGYDPFGEVLGSAGSVPLLGFQADFTDPVTGDVWMGARWYDGSDASFRSRDSVFGGLSTPVSLNRFTYGWANPLNMWDPDGREVCYVSGPRAGACYEGADGESSAMTRAEEVLTVRIMTEPTLDPAGNPVDAQDVRESLYGALSGQDIVDAARVTGWSGSNSSTDAL
ncbi:MAG: DNRLRE domain-containing protein, partial [Actinomycetota bacterium]